VKCGISISYNTVWSELCECIHNNITYSFNSQIGRLQLRYTESKNAALNCIRLQDKKYTKYEFIVITVSSVNKVEQHLVNIRE